MRVTASCHVRLSLSAFEQLSTEAGLCAAPSEVPWATAREVSVPNTMFGVEQQRGTLDLSAPPDLDSRDFWLRTRLPAPLAAAPHRLLFEGLAGIVDVWIAGEHRLRAENMFRAYELVLPSFAAGDELVLRFASLTKFLAIKRPRPRFRTRLIDAQQLRWVRTSLLGRTPGFSPRIPALGPYRAITLEAQPLLRVVAQAVSTRARAGRAQLSFSSTLELAPALSDQLEATLVLDGSAGSGRFPLSLAREGAFTRLHGEFEVDDAKLWWPHTHGTQPRSQLSVELPTLNYDDAPVTLDCGRIGFRELAVDRGDDGAGFRLLVNGQPLFCRGACWTVNDLVTLSDDNLIETLLLARDAGMNMLRVGGTMLYESEAFYEACDELGLLVFQDFMFANMDYPVGEPAFDAEVRAEASYQLGRFAGRPSFAVLCGGSEVEQQAAMLGLPPALGQSPLFHQLLPELVAQLLPEVPYVPNSPCGGALPFQVDAGIAHYYGVGAYMRPLHDARVSRVRFASECLAFANVPSPDAVESLLKDLEMPFHHPRWKERVPRDRGVGWDFEDVRDHYLEQLYHENARNLRYADPERYLMLSRAIVVDVMEATIAELRRVGSPCAGALVWWLKDLWLGAGWGVLDARAVPKSAYYALRRAFAPRALLLSDEGMNGPFLHVFNDRSEVLEATLSVALVRDGRTQVAAAERSLRLSAHSVQEVRVDAMFERFVDAGYLYRFGPANHDLLIALLRDAQGEVLARVAAQPVSTAIQTSELGLSATYLERAGTAGVLVRTQRFARRIEIELDRAGLLPEDNYFQLEPGGEQWVPFRHAAGRAPLGGAAGGRVRALNAPAFVRFGAPGVSA
jgi:beta-mannosidase